MASSMRQSVPGSSNTPASPSAVVESPEPSSLESDGADTLAKVEPTQNSGKAVDGSEHLNHAAPTATGNAAGNEQAPRIIATLESQIEEAEKKLTEVLSQLKSPETAAQTVQAHIKRLHRYNDIRDVGTGLFGLIAERRGVRLKDVFVQFGIADAD